MNKTAVLYFSGTGNSLYTARKIAEKTGGSLHPLPALVRDGSYLVNAETVVLVFPVYIWQATHK